MECPDKEGQTAGIRPLLSFHLFLFLLTAAWNMDIMAGALEAFKDTFGITLTGRLHTAKQKDRKARVPWSYHGKPWNLISELYRREKVSMCRSHGN